MLIHAPCVVSLLWTLTDAQHQPIDELTDPVEFFVGGDDLLPKLEQAITGQQAGFKADLHLEPEHAFGDYRAELVCFEDRSLFPEGIEEGMQFDGLPEGAKTVGMPTDAIYTITEIYPSHVVLDGNHPLAGVALNLAVTVVAVRDATPDEVTNNAVADEPISVLSGAPASQSLH